jgi:hypothetical protein
LLTINRKENPPYLDMELYWREESLEFKVHLKPNQQLKYLNIGSAHTNACFKSIPSGLIRRLSILTSTTPENENKTIDELYPLHIKALKDTDLSTPNSYPTLREPLRFIQDNHTSDPDSPETSEATKAKRKHDRERSVSFCAVHTKIWGVPVCKRIKPYEANMASPGSGFPCCTTNSPTWMRN